MYHRQTPFVVLLTNEDLSVGVFSDIATVLPGRIWYTFDRQSCRRAANGPRPPPQAQRAAVQTGLIPTLSNPTDPKCMSLVSSADYSESSGDQCYMPHTIAIIQVPAKKRGADSRSKCLSRPKISQSLGAENSRESDDVIDRRHSLFHLSCTSSISYPPSPPDPHSSGVSPHFRTSISPLSLFVHLQSKDKAVQRGTSIAPLWITPKEGVVGSCV